MAKPKAVVAMSGGVDSSVAAALLVEQGFDVTGVMLKLWRGEAANTNSGCCNVGAAEDARRVADVLGIRFYVLNFAEHFEETVVADFRRTYADGRTPNPCVRCNQWVKFGTLLEKADALDADVLATGHYARVATRNGSLRLLRGRDRAKDQSYVLWMLSQDDLARCRFPVGHLEKSETRRIAADVGLRTAAKPDSQEICFVRGGDLGSYIADNVPEASTPGPIFDPAGKHVGEHQGVGRYTVGQRRGLGISLGVPLYVTRVDAAANALHVGTTHDLAVGELRVAEVSFVSGPLHPGTPVLVQYRAHGEVVPGRILELGGGRVRVGLDDSASAVAPGQSAAFYSHDDPDELVGGGVIEAAVPARVVV